MNRFVHRILKSSTASSIVAGDRRRSRLPPPPPPCGAVGGGVDPQPSSVVRDLVRDEIGNAKLVYFGEYHSESRIASFLEELVVEWHRFLSGGSSSSWATTATATATTPRLHLIMEHFAVDMQPLLDRYAGIVVGGVDDDDKFPDDDDDGAFDALVESYKEDYGTEGHDLMPYRDLLAFCRGTSKRGRGDGTVDRDPDGDGRWRQRDGVHSDHGDPQLDPQHRLHPPDSREPALHRGPVHPAQHLSYLLADHPAQHALLSVRPVAGGDWLAGRPRRLRGLGQPAPTL